MTHSHGPQNLSQNRYLCTKPSGALDGGASGSPAKPVVWQTGCRGHERRERHHDRDPGSRAAAVAAAKRISELFLSSGPCRLRRTPGEDEVQVLVYADVDRKPDEGGYPSTEEEMDGEARALR